MLSGFPGQNLGILFEELWGLLPIIGVSGSSFVIVLICCIILDRAKLIYKIPTASVLTYFIIWPRTLSSKVDLKK